MTIQENIALAPLTTLRVGGAARYFAEARAEDDIGSAVEFARARDLPWFVMGGGSNLVVSDSGWPGLVLKIAIPGISRDDHGETVRFEVGAGVDWDEFAAVSVAADCAGIECLSGIPGTVGGTPVQNVGAYGQEVSDTIESVQVFDTQQERQTTLSEEECGFRYRTSIFNTAAKGRYIILRVTYRLTQGGPPSLKYAELRERFANSRTPGLAEVRDAVRQIRRSKGMLLVPDDPDCRSAGSFFKNPVLSEAQFSAVSKLATSRGMKIPSYPALDAHRKISAAWLVEHSGFVKGFALGSAAISHKHALALINTGKARAEDILLLKDTVQRAVHESWGIQLEPEPVMLGFT